MTVKQRKLPESSMKAIVIRLTVASQTLPSAKAQVGISSQMMPFRFSEFKICLI